MPLALIKLSTLIVSTRFISTIFHNFCEILSWQHFYHTVLLRNDKNINLSVKKDMIHAETIDYQKAI